MALITLKRLTGNSHKACFLASLGGALSLMLGLTVLFGWYTHNVPLIQIWADFAPMQINTALGFLLAGLGLLLIIGGQRRPGIACGIFVMLLGLLTVVEYVLGVDFGIDPLLVQHYIKVETLSPGRMAPNTALCFSLTGAALAVIGTGAKARKPTLITSGLASLTFGLGFVAMAGYLSNLEAAYGWGQLSHMAVHTASGFMILGVAIISLAWHRDVSGFSGTPSWFPLPVGIGVATIVVSFWLVLESHEAQLISQYGASGMLPFINDTLLKVGMVIAAALSVSVFLAQTARDRERAVVVLNSRLTAEIDERKRAQKDLLKSEERWQFALEGNRDGVWDRNVMTNEVFFSRRWKEMLGFAEGDIANSLDEWDKRIHPDDKEQVLANVQKHFDRVTPFYESEHRVLCKDGTYKWILDRGKVVSWTDDSRPQRMIGTHTDITQRKQMDEKLIKSQRLYATLNQINQAIARENDEQKLFQTICDIAIEFGKFRLAWIGLIDQESQLVKSVAFSGEGSDYLQHIKFPLTDDLTAKGPTARSIMEGKSVVFNNLEHKPDYSPWREQAMEKGYGSSGAFPIRLYDTIIGNLNVYAAAHDFFDEDEIKLLEEAAADISFALEKFEGEKKRKQVEQALRKSDALLNKSQKIAQIGSWELDLDTNCAVWSDEVYRLFGLQPQQFGVITYEAFLAFIHPNDRAAVDGGFTESIRNGCDTYEFEHRIIRRDNGKIRVVHQICEHLKDASGKIFRSIGTVQNITERKQAEVALLAKEHEQREILNCMVDAVITIDETGNILSFNKTAETLFGYSFDEVLGQNIKRLMPEPDSGKHDGYLAHFMETGGARVLGNVREVEGQHKNKQTFPIRLSVAELPANGTGKRRFIGTCQDLTQIKQQEEQLRRSQKMDALGKLTGGIAHDFNNILGVVSGYAQMLEDMLSGQPELADYAQEIYHAGKRGAKLTRKLLSFSRQEAAETIRLDLNKLLRQQQDMLQKTLTVRVQLFIDLADDVWPICLDSSDLEDAIVNMSINAMYAMQDKESGARLTIRTCNQSLNTIDARTLGVKAGDYVQLSLTDTGVGMDETIREEIFDPFFSTKGEQGTGLGLSQVFGFVKRAGGIIKVHSEPGHGSKFVLYFPRCLDDDIEEAAETSEDVIDLRGKETILIVDDEAALCNLASELLTQQGYQAFCAENAKQAFKILENEHIDLILSDVIMPEMDGYQLAAIVQEKYPAIKVQLTSGFADTWNLSVFDKSLHQNILHKPYDSKVLFKNIRALLDSKANDSSKKPKKR